MLPDHIHSIWTLPADDKDYPKRWGMIKARYTKAVKPIFHYEEWMNKSKTKRNESTIWQNRYWEHQIRNERDYHIHMDYIHHNPVKHKLVEQVKDWPYSTFHRYVKSGEYNENWCGVTSPTEEEFGE